MAETKKCSQCGTALPPDAPGGHCAKCLLELGLASGFLLAEPPPTASMTAEKAGDWIGHYKLLQQIGEGGCGIVWMAEQNEPMRRRVALKIIKLGMDTKQVITRFEIERQALALMDHPNIATVLDGGATATGRPFFVMELVRGVKITDYCDKQTLSTRQRLDLFIKVCQAVQHAHQKGIIHRDLKPSNILVTEQDGAPVPKVIDFGIAKASGGQWLTDKTLFTADEQFIGTPAYMSPEQAGLGGLDIDTRSDIYSLGVLLYELLTGLTPFAAKELSRAGLDEILRTIREKEPRRPSARLTTLGEKELLTISKCRQSEPAKLRHVLRGDLDCIVMKALEKDRSRRYDTAIGLARDLQRHLANEPVIARPPNRWYNFQKTVRRHKFGFAATAAVILALATGLGMSTWTLAQERHTQERTGVVEHELSQLSHQLLQDERLKLAVTLMEQGNAFQQIGKLSEAEAAYRRALGIRRDALPKDDLMVTISLHDLAAVVKLQGRLAEAEQLFREVLELRRPHLKPGDRELGACLADVAYTLVDQDKLAEAEPYARQSLAIMEEWNGNGWGTFNMQSCLGRSLLQQQKYAEAEPLLLSGVAGLEQRRDKLGARYQFVLTNAIQGVIKLYEETGRHQTAVEWKRKLDAPEAPPALTTP